MSKDEAFCVEERRNRCILARDRAEVQDISSTWKVARNAERTGVSGILVASGWSGSMYLVLVKMEEGNMEFKDV